MAGGAGDQFATIFCCLLIISIIVVKSSIKKNKFRTVIIPHPQPVYVPVQLLAQPIQQPVQIQQPSETNIFSQAQNLERARDFEGAAKAYQEAGAFDQAGRVRQQFLENTQPIVNIGNVGDTIMHDSVLISDNQSKTCSTCNHQVENDWDLCPNCQSQL